MLAIVYGSGFNFGTTFSLFVSSNTIVNGTDGACPVPGSCQYKSFLSK